MYKAKRRLANVFSVKFTNNESLKNIYDEIDKLEKTEINEVKYYNYTELFARFLLPAFIILVLEAILRRTVFKELI